MGITTATGLLVSVLGLVLVLLSGTICSSSRTLESIPKATHKHTNGTTHSLDTANGAGNDQGNDTSVHGMKVVYHTEKGRGGGDKGDIYDHYHDGKRKQCHYNGYDEDCAKGHDSGYGGDGEYDDGYGKGKERGCDHNGYGHGKGKERGCDHNGYGHGKGKDKGHDFGYGSGWNGYGYGGEYGGGGGGGWWYGGGGGQGGGGYDGGVCWLIWKDCDSTGKNK